MPLRERRETRGKAMRDLLNVEKSAFHPGEYVGYAHGVWRIKRDGAGWIARHRDDTRRPSIYARKLETISAELGKVAAIRC